MKLKLLFASVFLMIGGLVKGEIKPQKFNKAEFYEVMKSGALDAINREIEEIKWASDKEREGYEGALLMKKAGLLRRPKERLSLFKQGRIKLETAIIAHNDNLEFHFLRLAIEEHAPKIVKYHGDIENDKVLIVRDFNTLSPIVQHAILDYCENSKVLNKGNFGR